MTERDAMTKSDTMTERDADRDLLVRTVQDILTAFQPAERAERDEWDAGLWQVLAESEMTGVGLPEELGGSGGTVRDAAAIVECLAAGAAAVPVAEHLLVAAPSLAAAGLGLPDLTHPVTFTDAGTAEPAGAGRYRLTGTPVEVPWAGSTTRAVILAEAGRPGGTVGEAVLALVDLDGCPVAPRRNLADEPRGTVDLAGVEVAGELLDPDRAEAVRARLALARAVQLSGALGQVLDWTCAYAGERVQFGRTLSGFPSVRMDLARMAAEVSAVRALTEAAVTAADQGRDLLLPAAAAKIRAGAAVESVARSAHQIHGAIGFTREHRLHHLTRRLWAWRDEGGTERHWSRVLGERLTDGPGALWPRLVDAL